MALDRRHDALVSRVAEALARSGRGWLAVEHVRVLAAGAAIQADAAMVFGRMEIDPADPSGATITNPALVVEVLSPSTEAEDRGAKWHHYQRAESLLEYVLVSEYGPSLERYRRLSNGGWQYTHTAERGLELASGAVLDLARLYAGLPE